MMGLGALIIKIFESNFTTVIWNLTIFIEIAICNMRVIP